MSYHCFICKKSTDGSIELNVQYNYEENHKKGKPSFAGSAFFCSECHQTLNKKISVQKNNCLSCGKANAKEIVYIGKNAVFCEGCVRKLDQDLFDYHEWAY